MGWCFRPIEDATSIPDASRYYDCMAVTFRYVHAELALWNYLGYTELFGVQDLYAPKLDKSHTVPSNLR